MSKSFKYLGLEIVDFVPGSKDGYISYFDESAPSENCIKREYFTVANNDGSILTAEPDDEMDPSLFRKKMLLMFTKLNESNFITNGRIFGIRFMRRVEKNVPNLNAVLYSNNDIIIDNPKPSPYIYGKLEKDANGNIIDKKREHKNKKQHHHHQRRSYQTKPANEEKKEPVGIPDATGAPASPEQLQALVEGKGN